MGQELDEKDVMRSEDESKRDSERVGLWNRKNIHTGHYKDP
jgi:hypothetical protein